MHANYYNIIEFNKIKQQYDKKKESDKINESSNLLS